MAIIQISKLQVRSGNLVDLPQLDDAEFGWATDAKKLYIGKTTPNENIEILTSYSNVYFSQINGGVGNLNVVSPVTGQTLTYDATSNAWVNTGGNALSPGNASYYSNTPIHLGDVSDVFIGGGAIGYILETDGIGNLSWTPKGTISSTISNATKASPVVITTTVTNQFTSGMYVTITDVNGMTQLNGNSYYVKILTSSTFALYSDSGLTSPINGTGYSTYTSGGRAITASGAGGGTGTGGATYSIQYNSGGISTGDANLQWNYTTQALTINGTASVSGNTTVGNLATAGRIVSSISTGTAPFTVSSTTRVSNLNVATAGVANTVNDSAQPNITSVGTLTSVSVSGNATVGNLGTAGQIVSTIATGTAPFTVSSTTRVSNLNVATAGVANTVSDASQPNITSLGTLSSISVTGNANVGNLNTGGLITATGNIQGGNLRTAGILTVTGNATVGNIGATSGVFTNVSGNGAALTSITGANVTGTVANATFATTAGSTTTAGTVTTAAQPNITSTGTLTSVSVSGTATVGTLSTTSITAGANSTAGTITGNFTLTAGSKLQATYADLAEYYEADTYYLPGTVLEFGGDKEVTIAEDGTTRVAGVVSTDPAYAMNANCRGIAVAIALQGRVPTKVRGTIRKGDMMISAGDGYARPSISPQVGTVIGKSLENFDGIEGVIEVAIGRY